MNRKQSTSFVVVGLLLVIAYLVFQPPASQPAWQPAWQPACGTPDILLDPYAPPLKTSGFPVNIPTRGLPPDYTQVGLLTRDEKILPLMGRRIMTDKWQYYTISNTGTINTKLPLTVNGRSCTSEYGCDALSTGDPVFVEGYQQSFRATLYETAAFHYIPA